MRVRLITQQRALVCVCVCVLIRRWMLHRPVAWMLLANEPPATVLTQTQEEKPATRGLERWGIIHGTVVDAHRPSQFRLISPSFHHTGPLRSPLSADTKHRAELLTGGGSAALARLPLRRRWQLIGPSGLIFSSVSRFTSSPATVVCDNNLLSLWGVGRLSAWYTSWRP